MFFLFLFSFNGLKFRYSEKATKSLKIFQFVLNVISKQSGRFLLNFVNFSKYLNFKQPFLPPSLPATHMLWVDSFSWVSKKKRRKKRKLLKLKSAKVKENFGFFTPLHLQVQYNCVKLYVFPLCYLFFVSRTTSPWKFLFCYTLT